MTWIGLTGSLAISERALAQEITLDVDAERSRLIVGETLQLRVAVLIDGAPDGDVTNDPATAFASLLPDVLTVDGSGLVTAVSTGYAVVLAENDSVDPEGAQGWIQLEVRAAEDRDGDGLPNDFEIANGLDPDNESDGSEDRDNDGLDSLQEFLRGTDPNDEDTDGDGVADGAEVEAGTDPLMSDLPPPMLDERCIAAILNRTVQVDANGTFAIGNVPVPVGAFRVRVICERDGRTDFGQSPFMFGVPQGVTNFEAIEFGADDPIPVSLAFTSPATVLTPAANGAQLVTTGTLADGTSIDLTLADSGTFYLSSNPAIATVSDDGFVNAVTSGSVLVTATHEGAITSICLVVDLGDDADGDGILDDYERLNAIDPGGSNLARMAGVTVVVSSSSAAPELAIDGDLLTSWRTAPGDAANQASAPFIEVVLPFDAGVAQVRLSGNRSNPDGFDFFAGAIRVFDASGGELFDSGGRQPSATESRRGVADRSRRWSAGCASPHSPTRDR